MERFGGSWTERKLDYVEKYLRSYLTALKWKNFNTIYVDAFAGSGTWGRSSHSGNQEKLSSIPTDESEGFIEGSAMRAVCLSPGFRSYHFIEMDGDRLNALQTRIAAIPGDVLKRCHFHNGDANRILLDLCSKSDWKRSRAVVFLDPFGMQVPWTTIVDISKTRAIDLWWLFPLGQSVNRLLKRDGKISSANRKRLNEIFGEDDWYDRFYKPSAQMNLLGHEVGVDKAVNFDGLAQYVHERLKSVFPYVHPSKPLYNSKNVPIFLLCFAMANNAPSAIRLASKIVKSILEH